MMSPMLFYFFGRPWPHLNILAKLILAMNCDPTLAELARNLTFYSSNSGACIFIGQSTARKLFGFGDESLESLRGLNLDTPVGLVFDMERLKAIIAIAKLRDGRPLKIEPSLSSALFHHRVYGTEEGIATFHVGPNTHICAAVDSNDDIYRSILNLSRNDYYVGQVDFNPTKMADQILQDMVKHDKFAKMGYMNPSLGKEYIKSYNYDTNSVKLLVRKRCEDVNNNTAVSTESQTQNTEPAKAQSAESQAAEVFGKQVELQTPELISSFIVQDPTGHIPDNVSADDLKLLIRAVRERAKNAVKYLEGIEASKKLSK